MNAVRRSLKNFLKSLQISAFRDWILGEFFFGPKEQDKS